MKVRTLLRTAAALALFASSAAWSIPIGTVGAIDQLIYQTNLGNAGEATEKAWVASVLGLSYSDLVYEEKTDVTGSDWSGVDGNPGVYAFELSGPAEWFLIKTGNIGGGQPNRHFLFLNLGSLDWAVVRLADMGITRISNVSKISHVGEFNGPGTSVPEPATLGLLGIGLMGLALVRRRKRS